MGGVGNGDAGRTLRGSGIELFRVSRSSRALPRQRWEKKESNLGGECQKMWLGKKGSVPRSGLCFVDSGDALKLFSRAVTQSDVCFRKVT
jgi:hypothetical protein